MQMKLDHQYTVSEALLSKYLKIDLIRILMYAHIPPCSLWVMVRALRNKEITQVGLL